MGDGLHGAKQYIQVKTYESADAVIHHMQIVADKVIAGVVKDGDKIVHAIDFAVPQEIYAEVSQKAAALGLPAHVIPFDLSAAEAAEYVQQGFEAVPTIDVGSLFERFSISSASAMALHAVITACLIKKHTDENNSFLREVSKQGIVSAGGIATALITETTLKALGYATTAFPAIGTVLVSSLVARGVFRRILSRDKYANWLLDQTNKLRNTVQLLSSDTFSSSSVKPDSHGVVNYAAAALNDFNGQQLPVIAAARAKVFSLLIPWAAFGFTGIIPQ